MKILQKSIKFYMKKKYNNKCFKKLSNKIFKNNNKSKYQKM